MRFVFIFMLFYTVNMIGQQKLETSFYSFSKPKNTDVKFFNSSNEEIANTDVYEFRENDKPKYLLYLISNKLTSEYEPISKENFFKRE